MGLAAWAVCSSCSGTHEAPGAAVSATVSDSVARARADAANRAQPGYIVDSILPLDEEIRRFTASLATQPTQLEHGAPSRDSLITLWVRAVETSDSLALRRMTVTRAEFGTLVFPESQYTRAPYRQSPGLVWSRLSAASAQAYRRTMTTYGGRALGYGGYRCPEPVQRVGDNRLWTGCVLRAGAGGSRNEERALLGPIVARGNHFKFLSLAGGWR